MWCSIVHDTDNVRLTKRCYHRKVSVYQSGHILLQDGNVVNRFRVPELAGQSAYQIAGVGTGRRPSKLKQNQKLEIVANVDDIAVLHNVLFAFEA